MGYTLEDDYFRVDVDDRSSLYFRVSGGVRQVVATGDEAKDALILLPQVMKPKTL